MATSFIKFTDSPVFLGTEDGVLSATGLLGANFIAANSCEVNFEASLEPNRFLGQRTISDDFGVSGPKRATISISYLPLVGGNLISGVQEASLAPFTIHTGDAVSGYSIVFGSFLFKKCYLDTASLQITPYSVVRANAQFTSYDTSTIEGNTYSGFFFGSAPTTGTFPSALSALHALTTNISGDSESIPESKTDISVSYQCSRTAVYEVGQLTPRTVLLNSVTRTTNLGGENIGRAINFSGASAIVNLRLGEFGKLMNGGFNPSIDTKLHIGITGRVNSQNLSAQVGRTLEGSVTVIENIL